MTDVFDEELRRAIKAGMQEEFKGLEFTPEMQRRVMERIRAEGAGTGSSPRSSRGPAVGRLLRPLAWTAAAAAALLVAINTGLDGFQMTRQPPGGDLASTRAERAAPAQAPGAGEARMMQDSGRAAEQQAAPGAMNQPMVAEADGIAKQASGVPEPQTVLVPPAEEAEPAEPEDQAELPADSVPAPEPDAPVGGDEEAASPEVAIAMLPEGEAAGLEHQGFLVSLPVPAVPKTSAAGMMLMAAPVEGDVEAPAPDGRRVERVDQSVRLVDASGAVLWERSLAGPEGPGQLAVSPSGRIAVSFGGELYILDSRGETEQLLHLPEVPMEVAWAGDGLLAVADFSGVTVYRDGAALWSAPLLGEGMAPFGDLLLVWSGDQMAALDLPEGREVWRAVPEQPGAHFERVVVSPDGRLAALLAQLDGSWVLWVADAQGQVLLTEALPEEPAVTFRPDAVELELAGEVRSLPLSQ